MGFKTDLNKKIKERIMQTLEEVVKEERENIRNKGTGYILTQDEVDFLLGAFPPGERSIESFLDEAYPT